MSWLATQTGFSRPLVYKTVDELVTMDLVRKEKVAGLPTHVAPAHPLALQEYVRKRQETLRLAEESLRGVMGSLISEYTRSSKTPGFTITSGRAGIEALYKDILRTRANLSIMRASEDRFELDMADFITVNIKKQYAAGIRTRALCPKTADDNLKEMKSRDVLFGTERRVFSRERFDLPSQVMLYSTKVGIVAYGDTPLVTIIDNDAISKTFQIIFDLLWDSATEY
jgi:sugar-specific transcriptional regulator TrmB